MIFITIFSLVSLSLGKRVDFLHDRGILVENQTDKDAVFYSQIEHDSYYLKFSVPEFHAEFSFRDGCNQSCRGMGISPSPENRSPSPKIPIPGDLAAESGDPHPGDLSGDGDPQNIPKFENPKICSCFFLIIRFFFYFVLLFFIIIIYLFKVGMKSSYNKLI